MFQNSFPRIETFTLQQTCYTCLSRSNQNGSLGYFRKSSCTDKHYRRLTNNNLDQTLIIIDFTLEQCKANTKMEEVILFIIITVYMVIALISILSACGLLRCLFFRRTLSPIRDGETIPGLYTLDVALQQPERRQSIYELLNDIPIEDQPILEPTGEIG